MGGGGGGGVQHPTSHTINTSSPDYPVDTGASAGEGEGAIEGEGGSGSEGAGERVRVRVIQTENLAHLLHRTAGSGLFAQNRGLFVLGGCLGCGNRVWGLECSVCKPPVQRTGGLFFSNPEVVNPWTLQKEMP